MARLKIFWVKGKKNRYGDPYTVVEPKLDFGAISLFQIGVPVQTVIQAYLILFHKTKSLKDRIFKYKIRIHIFFLSETGSIFRNWLDPDPYYEFSLISSVSLLFLGNN